MKSTLIIIDMQDCYVYPYTTTYRKCINSTVRSVKNAVRRGDHILFVEYYKPYSDPISKKPSEEPTCEILRKAVAGYKNVHYVFKANNDGGREVANALRTKRLPRKHVRVCGVYADWCVRKTVESLATIMPRTRINLIYNSISCHVSHPFDSASMKRMNQSKDEAIVKMKKHPNVFVKK